MNTDSSSTGGRTSSGAEGGDTVEPISQALLGLGVSERFRLLGTLFERLAVDAARGAAGERDDQLSAISKRLQSLGEERASLEDMLASAQADLAQRTSLLEAEQTRAAQQDRIIQEQRVRIDDLLNERREMEAKLVERAATIHDVERDHEQLLVRLQRAESRAADQSRVDLAESGRRDVAEELRDMQERFEQLRIDKETDIEALKGELNRARSLASQSADVVLAALWDTLARAKPSLVEGHVAPNAQAAERLAEGYVEVVHFADNFDKSMCVFLDKYTKHSASVKVPWGVYAKSDDVLETARKTLAVKGGRPVALLKMRLRMLSTWAQAAMIGADSAIESIASELEAHLRGEQGTQADPNRKIKDYLREDGHYLFMERVRELRSQRLAETFGRSG